MTTFTDTSFFGTHLLEVLSQNSNEVAAFGNVTSNAFVRFYDKDSPKATGYIIGLSNNVFAMYKEASPSNTTISIGTVNPLLGAGLHVQGTIATSNIRSYTTNNTISFSGSTLSGVSNINITGSIYQNGAVFSSAAPSQWTTSNTNVYITSNVGIGTTNPVGSLHVFSSNLGQGTVSLRMTTVTGTNTRFLSSFAPGDVIVVAGSGTYTVSSIFNDSILYIASLGTAVSNATYSIIRNSLVSSGSVGISTTTPLGAIQISGVAYASDRIMIGNNSNSLASMVDVSGSNLLSSSMVGNVPICNFGCNASVAAFEFGSLGNYFSFSNQLGITSNTPWFSSILTMEAFVYYTSFANASHCNVPTLMGLMNPGTQQIGTFSNVYFAFGAHTDGNLRIAYSSNYSLRVWDSQAYSIQANKWTHIAASIDNSGFIRIFIDGQSVRSTGYIFADPIPPANSGYPFVIGQYSNVNPSVLVSDVRIVTGSTLYVNAFPTSIPSTPLSLSGTGSTQLLLRATPRLNASNLASMNALDVAGGVAIGTFAGLTQSPTNGLIVSGNVGVGTNNPLTNFHVVGNGPTSGTVSIVSGSLTTVRGAGTSFTTMFQVGDIITITGSGSYTIANITNNNLLTISTNGTTVNSASYFNATVKHALLVNRFGNVGIGTTNPLYGLHVQSDINTVGKIYLNGVNQYLDRFGSNTRYFNTISGNNGHTFWVWNSTGARNAFEVLSLNNSNAVVRAVQSAFEVTNSNNGSSLYVDLAGNIGIGSVSPISKLDVNGNVRATSFSIPSADTFAYATISVTGYDMRISNSASANVDIRYNAGTSSNTGFRVFDLYAGVTRLIATGTGNVGIGSGTPGHLLDVAGNLQSKSGLCYVNSFFDNTNSIWNVFGNSGSAMIRFGNATTTTWDLRSDNGGDMVLNYWNSFPSTSTTSWRATTAGNVGVGTATVSNTLAVNGNASIGTYSGIAAPANSLIVSGNVGVGTTLPNKPLDVIGDINFTGNLYKNNILINNLQITGDISVRKIDESYLEMNGQIVSQTQYPNLFSTIGHQPEFVFSNKNLNPGIFPVGNITNTTSIGNQNLARDGSNMIAVGSLGLILRSTDDGNSWSLIGSPAVSTAQLNFVNYMSNLWIIGGNGSSTHVDSPDGIVWTQRVYGSSFTRHHLGFNVSGTALVVGSAGNIFRSTNATSWTQITSGTTNTLRWSDYGSNAWVVVGDSSTILYSSNNGLSFLAATPPATGIQLNQVKYVGGSINLFVTIGNNSSAIWTSPDGVTWSTTTITSASGNYNSIAVSDNQQQLAIVGSARVLRSANATSWTGSSSGNALSVEWNEPSQRFYACTTNTIIYSPSNSLSSWTYIDPPRNHVNRCLMNDSTSSNIYIFTDACGILKQDVFDNANSNVIVEPGYNIREVAYGNGVYVAVARDALSSSFYSSNLETWTYRKTTNTTARYTVSFNRIKFLNGAFVGVGNTDRMFYSTNGINWSDSATFTSSTLRDIVWTGERYVAVGDSGVVIQGTSLAGLTRTQVLTGTSYHLYSIEHLGEGVLIAAGQTAHTIRSVDHGVTWSKVIVDGIGPYTFVDTAYDPDDDIVAAVTSSGTIIAYSFDKGITWNTKQSPTSYGGAIYTGIEYGNGIFIAYGRNSIVGISADGTTWEWTSDAQDMQFIDMVYGDGFFVGAGFINNATTLAPPFVAWSPDGRNWTVRTVPHSMLDIPVQKQYINYLNGNFVLSSYFGAVSTNVWSASFPYDRSTQFQIPTRYIGTGESKMWINGAVPNTGNNPLTSSGDFTPASNTYNLGSPNASWSNIYLNTINFGRNSWAIRESNSNLQFLYNNSNNVNFDQNGNVGIGTTNPIQKVDIIGNTIMTGNLGIGTASTSTKLNVYSTGIGTTDYIIALANAGGATGSALFDIQGQRSYFGYRYINTEGRAEIGTGDASKPIVFAPASTERMRISGDGNVGIGTINPASTLDVRGNIVTGKGQSGTASTLGGGPFFKQESWDSPGTTHNIAFPSYCIGDNSTGTLHIHATNKPSGAPKMATMQVMFIKMQSSNVVMFPIMSQRSVNMTDFSVAASTSNILVTTDSDCAICWTSIGSY